MQGVFITGTGTNVGKTFVATAIARNLTEQGLKVIPRKPIESGCLKQGNELIPQDAHALMQAANYQGALSEICPYRFEPAISPVRAAHLANQALTTEQLVNICLQGSENGFTLVEGAGGFYSPLTENGLNADLAMALQLPVLLVADDCLGVLSHVLLNVEAILARGLQLAGVVVNTVNNSNDIHMNNSADLRERLDCPVFSSPYVTDGNNELPDALFDALLPSSSSSGSQARVAG